MGHKLLAELPDQKFEVDRDDCVVGLGQLLEMLDELFGALLDSLGDGVGRQPHHADDFHHLLQDGQLRLVDFVDHREGEFGDLQVHLVLPDQAQALEVLDYDLEVLLG